MKKTGFSPIVAGNLVLLFLSFFVYGQDVDVTIAIDPRATYLYTDQDDDELTALPAVPIDLNDLGIEPGDWVQFNAVGDCSFNIQTIPPMPDQEWGIIGVLSSSDVLLGSSFAHRVPGAIEAECDVITSSTWLDGTPTDIPEDFTMFEKVVRLPAGVRYLFVTPHDARFWDNGDPDGDYGIRIIKPPLDGDADGLYDEWEDSGLDWNADCIDDLELGEMGADPEHEDLFVELDVMENVPYSKRAIDMVKQAFANAPGGGITLHVLTDRSDVIPNQVLPKDFKAGFDVIKSQHFGGNPPNLNDPNRNAVLECYKLTFRYCIFGDRFADKETVIGRGEWPGNDFAVTCGGLKPEDQTAHMLGGTFMHELGHNLNLHHGGGDPKNYKPNYVSVMNYGFDQFFNGNTGDPLKLDYSREPTMTLYEGSLDENEGIFSSLYSHVFTFYGLQRPGNPLPTKERVLLGSVPYDWNKDAIYDSSVQVDLNYLGPGYPGDACMPSPNDVLKSYIDWNLIELPIGTTGDFLDGVHETLDEEEKTVEIVDWLKWNVPIPAGYCAPGDFDCDSRIRTDDYCTFAASWGSHEGQLNWNPLCDISEPNDGVIDELDLAMFCTRWLKCYTGEPPQPDPMQWQLEPLAISDSSIFMEAVEASDPCGVQYYFQCVDGNCNDSGWQDSRIYEDTNLMPETAYTYRVITRDNSFRQNAGAWSVIKTATTRSLDTNVPSPDPMTWLQVPYATSDSSIAMEATTAVDESWVEYYFECTAGGGHDSGWQYSPFYEDSGLLPATSYSYGVRVRDRSLARNMTGLSSVESVMTLPDATPPEPNPMTWAHPPGEQNGFDSIVMEATTAVDPCGVEYYFECVSGNCHDSGWQDSPFYEDWPLDANSQYTYRVQARDKSPARNATDWSVEVSTSTEPHCPPVFNIMHVESIVCETVSVGGGDKAGRVTVTILDDCGNPASDVRVVGTFSGDFNEQQGANTTSSGSAVFTSHREVKSPSYTFCIDLVLDHNNTYTYDERYNVEICDSY